MEEVDFNFAEFSLDDHERLPSNMNYVARIEGLGVIKITPEGGKLAAFPNIKLSKDRILRDLVFNHFCKLCPEIIAFDLSKRYFVMEDLGLKNLRSQLREANQKNIVKALKPIPTLLKNLNKFYDSQKELPEIFREENPLVKEHYAHIFEYPLFNHELIKLIWLENDLAESKIEVLEKDFLAIQKLEIKPFDLSSLKGTTLIHGDLHTGSIINRKTRSYIIDGEFAHLAKRDFDLGMLYANLIIDLALSGNDFELIKTLNLDLSKLALEIAFFEIIRQMIGASFSVPLENRVARDKLFSFMGLLKLRL